MSLSVTTLSSFSTKLASLYFLIGLGWLGGRYLALQTPAIANILIYFVSPIVFFGSVASLEFSPNLFACLVLTWVPALLCISMTRAVASRCLDEPTTRVVATSSAMSNGGYFGIPLYLMFFGEQTLGIWMLLVVGSTLFETTIGYYQLARAHFSILGSIRRVLLLPVFSASILALLVSWLDWELPLAFKELHREFRGAYVVLGMMIIGIALSTIRLRDTWQSSLTIALSGRLLLYPALMTALIFIESHTLRVLSDDMRRAALVFGLLPVAANTVAYAAQLKLSDNLAGKIVFVSTVICTFVAPVIVLAFLV